MVRKRKRKKEEEIEGSGFWGGILVGFVVFGIAFVAYSYVFWEADYFPVGEIFFYNQALELSKSGWSLSFPPLAFWIWEIGKKVEFFPSAFPIVSAVGAGLLCSASFVLGNFMKGWWEGMIASVICLGFAGLGFLARMEPPMVFAAGFGGWAMAMGIAAMSEPKWSWGFWSCLVLGLMSGGVLPIFLLLIGAGVAIGLGFGFSGIRRLFFQPSILIFLGVSALILLANRNDFSAMQQLQITDLLKKSWFLLEFSSSKNTILNLLLFGLSLCPWGLLWNYLLFGLSVKKKQAGSGFLWVLIVIGLALFLMSGVKQVVGVVWGMPAVAVAIAVGVRAREELSLVPSSRAMLILGGVGAFLVWMFPWWGGQLAVQAGFMKRQMQGFWVGFEGMGAREIELVGEQLLPALVLATICGAVALFLCHRGWQLGAFVCWVLAALGGVWCVRGALAEVEEVASLRPLAKWLANRGEGAVMIVDLPEEATALLRAALTRDIAIAKGSIFFEKKQLNDVELYNLKMSGRQVLVVSERGEVAEWRRYYPMLEVIRRRKHYTVMMAPKPKRQ